MPKIKAKRGRTRTGPKEKTTYFSNDADVETPSIIVNRTDSNFSRAAVKLLLDNIIEPEDVENIFKTDSKLKAEGEVVADCQFCNKKCTTCELCCPNKGLQLYLLNKALERINCIPISCKNIFCKAKPGAKCSKRCSEKCKKQLSMITESIVKSGTFNELKLRLRNLKRYYPYIYRYKGNIIEEWGRNDMFCKIKPEILKYDSENSTIFWI